MRRGRGPRRAEAKNCAYQLFHSFSLIKGSSGVRVVGRGDAHTTSDATLLARCCMRCVGVHGGAWTVLDYTSTHNTLAREKSEGNGAYGSPVAYCRCSSRGHHATPLEPPAYHGCPLQR
jgi:hypothetical protein